METTLLSPKTRVHKIFALEVEIDGLSIGDDVGRLYLVQRGTAERYSFVHLLHRFYGALKLRGWIVKFIRLFIVLCFVACGSEHSQKPPTSPNNPETVPTPDPGTNPTPQSPPTSTSDPIPSPTPSPTPSPIANCDGNAAGSILADCNKQHRSCVANAQSAACADCVPGFVNDNNTCQPIVLCTDTSCDVQNRACNENHGQALCTECLDGYVANSNGDCVATCDVKHCSTSQICVPVFDASAICADTAPLIGTSTVYYPSCGDNKTWYPSQKLSEQGCKTCDPCIGKGLTTRLYPVVNQEGQCVCETKDGYFYDPGTHQIAPCDEDGDGWVRYTAKRAMDTKNCTGPNCDWVTSDNARCHVRTIDTVVLESETGLIETILLKDEPLVKSHLENGVLPLYEAETNDDFSLRPIPLEPILPNAGRAFTSGELNSFTKACVNDTADFNDNHIADIAEYQGMSAPAAAGNVDVGWLEPYTALAYFTELYKGTYVAKGKGEYHITERTRQISPNALPFMWSSDKERACYRGVDTNYFNVGESPTKPKIGLDFARYNDMQTIPRGRIADFGHHSQFRCIQVVADTLGATTRSLAPQKISVGDNGHSLQTCTLTSNQNQFTCHTVSNVAAGFVGWSLAQYQDYGDTADYLRGCINECVDRSLLPTLQTCPNEEFGATCHGDTNNFGAFACDSIACGPWYFDRDGDGYAYFQSPPLCYAPKVDPDGNPISTGSLWIHSNANIERGECDNVPNRSPAKSEICDGIDNNCDGNIDETFHDVRQCEVDGNCANATSGYDKLVEICDGFDNNCRDGIDEGFYVGTACDDGAKGVCKLSGQRLCSPDKGGTVCSNTQHVIPDNSPFPNNFTIDMYDPARDSNCDGVITQTPPIEGLADTYLISIATKGKPEAKAWHYYKFCRDLAGTGSSEERLRRCVTSVDHNIGYSSHALMRGVNQKSCSGAVVSFDCIWKNDQCLYSLTENVKDLPPITGQVYILDANTFQIYEKFWRLLQSPVSCQ
jgi:hypothetical protein